jgi:hypothetical protein
LNGIVIPLFNKGLFLKSWNIGITIPLRKGIHIPLKMRGIDYISQEKKKTTHYFLFSQFFFKKKRKEKKKPFIVAGQPGWPHMEPGWSASHQRAGGGCGHPLVFKKKNLFL